MKSMKSSIYYFVIISLLFGLTSCGSDDDIDLREEAVGSFNYVLKAYNITSGTAVYLGDDPDFADETGIIVITKNSSEASSINLTDDGETIQGSNIAQGSNGFTFQLPTQTLNIEGNNVTIQGYNNWELDGKTYPGFYETSTKKIYVAFEGTLNIDGTSIKLMFTYEGTRS